MPVSDVLNLATGPGIAFLIGIILLVGPGIAVLLTRGRAARPAVGYVALVGVFVLVISFVAAGLTPAATGSIAPPAKTQTVNAILSTTPALLHGQTWNSVTSTLTVNLLYNVTSHAFCSVTVFAATHGCGLHSSATYPNYVLLPLNLIRTDAQNTTNSFPMSIASIPTQNSLGANPQTYSICGFTAQTSTSPGQWQMFFHAGTTAGQKPTVSAPSVSTNVITDGVAVKAFANTVNTIHISLAGGNSTSAPTPFAAALQNYTSYPVSITIGNSQPASVVINFVIIGWTT